MSPELLLKLLLSSLAPDHMMEKYNPDQVTAALSGPVGATAGVPQGLWGSFMGGIQPPQLSQLEMISQFFPKLWPNMLRG